MAKRKVQVYEIVRWKVGGVIGRFHVRYPGDAATLCGDPVITTGEVFVARPPVGIPTDPLHVMSDLSATRASCHDCVEAIARGA